MVCNVLQYSLTAFNSPDISATTTTHTTCHKEHPETEVQTRPGIPGNSPPSVQAKQYFFAPAILATDSGGNGTECACPEVYPTSTDLFVRGIQTPPRIPFMLLTTSYLMHHAPFCPSLQLVSDALPSHKTDTVATAATPLEAAPVTVSIKSDSEPWFPVLRSNPEPLLPLQVASEPVPAPFRTDLEACFFRAQVERPGS